MKKETFDSDGLLLAIKEIGKAYSIEKVKDIYFCQICLGSNIPNQQTYPKNGWCCGAWCDSLIPPFKICNIFQADKKKIKRLAENIRPDGKGMSGYSVENLRRRCKK